MSPAPLTLVVAAMFSTAAPARSAAPVAAPVVLEPLQGLARAALDEARGDAELRIELLEVLTRGRSCRAQTVSVDAVVGASGVYPLQLDGQDAEGVACHTTASARVRVFAPALRLKSSVARGAELGATDLESGELELKSGMDGVALPWRALPAQARAARPLPRGAWLRPSDVEHGPRVGEAVLVSVRSGVLRLEESGRVAPCPGGSRSDDGPVRACASLKGGRRVAGVLDPHSGVLVVEVRR